MTVRQQYITRDIQDCIYALISGFSGAPWSAWSYTLGWPDFETPGSKTGIEGDFDPTVYILEPVKTNEYEQQGGGNIVCEWSLIIGFWLNRDSGGPDEMQVWVSNMAYKFQARQAIHTATFTVKLGTTTYTNTTLTAQGIYVNGITGQSYEMSENKDAFRREMTIYLQV